MTRRPPRLEGEALVAAIRAAAGAEGFAACGVTTAAADPAIGERLRAWLDAGHHGGMGWMAERIDQRASPDRLWPEARSVIMLAMSYTPEDDPLEGLAFRDRGLVSAYARGRDYHDVVKGALKRLAGEIVRLSGGAGVKVFVDTAPVMERSLAAAAGLGWQGKHTVLIGRDLGNFTFLGAIFTDLALPPDAPEPERCGACRRCLEICPTGAFPQPFVLDARRCISYLTIEHKGPIPAEFRAAMGNRIYGCDDCLAVCPWNKFAKAAGDARLVARQDLARMPLADLAGLDDAAFRALFAGTAVKRIGRDRFVRNVLIAIGNSAEPSLIGAAEARLADGAAIVRGAAVWAAARLGGRSWAAERHDVMRAETDPDVLAEWRAALATD
jgi:epoxyqueuosine reductase